MFGLTEKGYDIRNNVLELMAKDGVNDCFALIYIKGEEKLIAHYKEVDNTYLYLWNIKNGYPDSAIVCVKKYLFNFKRSIPSNSASNYSDEDLSIEFPKYSLFDTLYLSYSKFTNIERKTEYFNFEHYDQPIRKSITLKIKPKLKYDQKHSFLYTVDGESNLNFAGGTWANNQIVLQTRDLVTYTIALDTIPPEISHLKSEPGKLKFKIQDKMSGINNYEARLNEKWVLMNFDEKYGILWSEDGLNISGHFILKISDNSENNIIWERTF